MKKFKSVTGGFFHLRGNDIDTDRIIPARYLKCVTFDGLGDNVFKDDRDQLNGEHPFDLEQNKDCTILVVDQNFGSGSSREHAVPALTQWGVQAIIGLSFAEIFRGNAVGNGLVCVAVDAKGHEFILSELEKGESLVQIDLEKMRIFLGADSEKSVLCTMSESERDKLMTGTWDDIATCFEAGAIIDELADRLPYFYIPASCKAASGT